MSDILTKELIEGLAEARRLSARKGKRLRIRVGGVSHPILRLWDTGFSVDRNTTPPLRGLVDILDGSRHLYQALVVTSDASDDEQEYEFKRSTPAADGPARDFIVDENAPRGLIGRP